LSLLTFHRRVSKKGVENPLHAGLENQGLLLAEELIIYESLFDQ
jgi:hypothetical protein